MFTVTRCRSFHPTNVALRCEHSSDRPHMYHRALDISTRTFVEWNEADAIALRNADRVYVQRDTPILSWRWWRLERSVNETINPPHIPTYHTVYRLCSITAHHIWEGPVCTTRTLPDGSLARVARDNPSESGAKAMESNEDYGVYSYKTPDLLAEYNRLHAQIELVLGRVENHGHVVEHDFGLRAQKVIIQELWMFMKDVEARQPVALDFEKRYGCNVSLNDMSRLTGWFKLYGKEDAADVDSR